MFDDIPNPLLRFLATLALIGVCFGPAIFLLVLTALDDDVWDRW